MSMSLSRFIGSVLSQVLKLIDDLRWRALEVAEKV